MKIVKAYQIRRRRIDFLEYLLLVTAITCILGTRNALIAAEAPPSLNISRDGCEARCGEVNIPFPFGIGPQHCFLDKSFEIVCNTSTFPPKPFLKQIQREVLQIPVFYSDPNLQQNSEPSVQVKGPISYFNNCGEKRTGNALNLTGTQFYFSKENTFVAVSCGVLAKIALYYENMYSEKWCKSACSSPSAYHGGGILCDGTDCCEMATGDVSDSFDITFDNSSAINDQDQRSRESECEFAFMVDNNYWSNYKKNSTASFKEIRDMDNVPILLNWYMNFTDIQIFGTNMSESLSNNKFHYCKEYWRHLRCYCHSGIRGNPYLVGGCNQDINECEDEESQCDPGATCVNTFGGYHCNYKRRSIFIGVGSALGALFLLFGIWCLYKFIKKRKAIKRKQKFFKRNGGLLLQQQISSEEGNVQTTKLFSSNDLRKATDNFSIDRILGQGGQGTVYKGMLDDGKIVAIKKSKMVDEAQLSEFINEVVILSQINHRNVVQLLGCCLETEVPLLVYEFVPNGTLSQYIRERNEEFPFTWKMRLRVTVEVAGAISYLHSSASHPIYHRDIKSTNILLDEKYRAKVADFGTSRTISIEQSHLTTLVYGTFGYLDPEYYKTNQFTDKSDVYSFGVVLVELLTGQKAISQTRSEEGHNLATYFTMIMETGNVFDIVDPKLLEDTPKEEIEGLANIAQKCLNLSGRNRPTMKEVAILLEGIQRSEATSFIVQQNHEEVDYIISDFNKPWDVVSTSAKSALDKTASTCTSSLQELALLSFESH